MKNINPEAYFQNFTVHYFVQYFERNCLSSSACYKLWLFRKLVRYNLNVNKPWYVLVCPRLKARLHDRKIGYGPDKKRVRTSHFCPCKHCGSCLSSWLRKRDFFGHGAIDGYGPKIRKKRVRISFLILTSLAQYRSLTLKRGLDPKMCGVKATL